MIGCQSRLSQQQDTIGQEQHRKIADTKEHDIKTFRGRVLICDPLAEICAFVGADQVYEHGS